MASLTDYGFPFNSVTNDRQYNASVWRKYFSNLLENGVIGNELNELAITESDTPAKTVKVDTGYIFINGVQYGIETSTDLTIDDNSSGSTRIDRIIVRVDYTSRLAEIDVLKGTAGAGAPTLTQTTTTYELSLAQVEASNGFTTITNSNITDERDYFRYKAKPAWYPEGEVPLDAYMYLLWKNELTQTEIDDIEANSSLMDIINNSSIQQQINSLSNGNVPSGGIIMWSGTVANIPANWALCDGNNGTPNLTDRFIVGAGNTYTPGDTGGENTHQLTDAEMPSHNHYFSDTTSSAGSHSHSISDNVISSTIANTGGSNFGIRSTTSSTSSAGSHTHSTSGNTNTAGGDNAHENRPPYYALAYIMKL